MSACPAATITPNACRRVVLLGSTGSIGTNCLEVVASLGARLEVLGLSAHSRWETLLEQARRWRPRWITITNPQCADRFDPDQLNGTRLLQGEEGIAAMVRDPDVDVVVTVSSTGIATPSIEARVGPEMGFRPTVMRVPVFGRGCAGGVSGLTLGARLARAEPGEVVLVVVIELCTLA